MSMRLILAENSSACVRIMAAVAELYAVVPVMSERAFEEFEFGEGIYAERRNLYHAVFGFYAIGGEETYPALESALLTSLKQAWAPGSTVMWRAIPKIWTGDDVCYGADNQRIPPKIISTIRARLGSFKRPSISSVDEGAPLPQITTGSPQGAVT